MCAKNEKTIKYCKTSMFYYQTISTNSCNWLIDNVVNISIFIINKYEKFEYFCFCAFIWLQKTNFNFFRFFCFCFNWISINIENKIKHDENENDEIEKKNDTLKTNQMKMLQIIEKLFRRLQIYKQKNHRMNNMKISIRRNQILTSNLYFYRNFWFRQIIYWNVFFVAKFNRRMYESKKIKMLFMKSICQNKSTITWTTV